MSESTFYFSNGQIMTDLELSKVSLRSLNDKDLRTANDYYWEMAANPNKKGDCSADVLLLNSEITARHQNKLNKIMITLSALSLIASVVGAIIGVYK